MSRLIEAGSLDRQIKILRAGIVRDSNGDDVDGYTPSGPIWASARPGGGRERLLAAQTAADAPMVFRLRWSPAFANLSPADRVEYPIGGGRSFDIVSVNEIGRREGIEIAATAGSSAGLVIVSPPNYLLGAVEGTSQVLGSLIVTAIFAGSIVASGQMNGALLSGVTLAAALSGAGSIQGAITARAGVAGQATGAGSFTGGITAAARLAGQAIGTGVNSANLSAAARLSAQTSGAGTLSGALTSAIVYDPDAQTYFNAMTVQPTAARKALISDLIAGLKADNAWTVWDWFVLLASHDAQAHLIDARRPSRTMIAINSPTFTVDRGSTGDGAQSYLSAGETWQASGNFGQDSATLGVWCNLAASSNQAPHIGVVSSGASLINPSPTQSVFRMNNVSNLTASTTGKTGHRTVTRTDANTVKGYLNGALIASTTAITSQAPPTGAGCALRGNSVYSSDRLAALYSGGGATDAQIAAMQNRLNTFLSAIGAQ